MLTCLTSPLSLYVSGRHTVEVQYGGRQIDGSPFYVDVFDLATIRIQNFQNGGVGETASFECKYTKLKLSVVSVIVMSHFELCKIRKSK